MFVYQTTALQSNKLVHLHRLSKYNLEESVVEADQADEEEATRSTHTVEGDEIELKGRSPIDVTCASSIL